MSLPFPPPLTNALIKSHQKRYAKTVRIQLISSSFNWSSIAVILHRPHTTDFFIYLREEKATISFLFL